MPLPTELVGSLPRMRRLEDAYAARERGELSREQLLVEQDRAAEESVRLIERTGEAIVTGGEQREPAFASYPLAADDPGLEPPANLAPEGHRFGIFGEAHHRRVPLLLSGPFRYAAYGSEFVAKTAALTSRPLKQAVIAPSMLMLMYPLDRAIPDYSRDQFLADLCDEAERDIRGCFEAGAARVSIDFTEARLAKQNEGRNPWTGRDMLADFIELNNRVIDRFSAAERENIGVHVCTGDDVRSDHDLRERVLDQVFGLNAGYFLVPAGSDRDEVARLCAANLRDDARGVSQVCFVGVIDPFDLEVESAEEVRDRLLAAAERIPPDRLGATDDCGFSMIGRAREGVPATPERAREAAMRKISNRVEGAAMASAELGV